MLAEARLKTAADIPAEITTPDRIETRLAAPEVFDGMPSEATAEQAG